MNVPLDTLSRNDDTSVSRHRFPAWLIPASIVFGFALLFLALFRDRLVPAPEVDVAIVLTTAQDVATSPADAPQSSSTDGSMAFQASGWIEPDPLPIKATALVDGVIDEVHVLEGEPVKKGQLLASLIQDDYRLDLESARQTLQMREAELMAHHESVATAHRNVAAAKAKAAAAAALVDETGDRARRIDGLPSGALADVELVAIQSAYRKAQAAETAALAVAGQAEAEAKRLEAQTAVLESSVKTAGIEIEKAELAFSRTRISAPADGRVLRLLASPGQKKMLAMDDPDSATVAILYQPDHLQVRVDVPLTDAARLQIGQHARIRSSLLPDTVFHGEVSRITGEADLQRNTLQAKVRIHNPSDQLRPEMLCRVEFLETVRSPGTTSSAASGSLVTWIPEVALDGNTAWVCNPDTKRVEHRPVTPGNETKNGHVRINQGLRPGERVVLSPRDLKNGQRVNPKTIQP